MSDAIRNHIKKYNFDINIVPPVKAMVFNRLLLRVSEWIKTQAIKDIFPKEIPLHHYYRSLDYLMDHKSSIEEDIFWNASGRE